MLNTVGDSMLVTEKSCQISVLAVMLHLKCVITGATPYGNRFLRFTDFLRYRVEICILRGDALSLFPVPLVPSWTNPGSDAPDRHCNSHNVKRKSLVSVVMILIDIFGARVKSHVIIL